MLINFGSKIRLSCISTYGLTYDEVLIVDPETPITREEYGKELGLFHLPARSDSNPTATNISICNALNQINQITNKD